jgi:hypothetical protein
MRVFGFHLRRPRRRVAQAVSIAMVAANMVVVGVLAGPAAAANGPCDAPINKVACENSSHVADERSDWQVQAFDDSIVGYADDISYAPGNTGLAITTTMAPG